MKKTLIGSRVLAVVLALVMLITCAGVLPLGLIASAADPSFDGYLYNGDFETGNMSNWSILYGNMEVVSGGHDGSGYALKVAGSQWSCIYQGVQIEPNTDYRLSGWVKRVSGTGAHYLYAKGSDGANISAINGTKQYFKYTDSDWVYHKWEFNSGSYTSVEPRITIEDANSVFLYDDIKLEPLPKPSSDGFISNGDFELGDFGAWSKANTCSVVEGGHDGSGYCARVAGSAWSKINQNVTVEPNTDYRLSGWVKREAGAGAHYFNAKGNNSAASSLTTLNKTSPWHRYAAPVWVWHVWDFNSGDNTSINIRVDIEDAASVCLYDDITLRKLTEADKAGYLNNGDFEAGIPNGWQPNSTSSVVAGGFGGSNYAMKVDGFVKQYIRVDSMSDYRVTAQVKRVKGTGSGELRVQKDVNVYEAINGTSGVFSNATDGWEEHSFEFNSGRTTQVTLFLATLDAGTVYAFDNVTVEKIAKVEPDYSGVLKGDVDLNGEVNADDLALIRDLGGTAEGAAAYAADMNCDGGITPDDLQMLDDYLAMGDNALMALYPTQGETVANGNWQIDELLHDYYPGKSDDYSGIYFGMGSHTDAYERDPVVLRWISRAPQETYTVRLTSDVDPVTGDADFSNAKEYTVQGTELSLQNLLVDTWYVWQVEGGGSVSSGVFYTADTVRTLSIDGVTNTRDLGGWKTIDGKYRIRYGVAYRGAEMEGVTADGIAAAADLGIKTDVDLRGRGSHTGSPLGPDVNWYLSGEYGGAMYYNSEKTTISDLTSVYVQGTVNALRAFTDADNFPAYFHCTYGRDRTGTLAMFLLGICGVSLDDILKDYEMTFLTEFAGGTGRTITAYEGITKTAKWLIDNYAPGGTLKQGCEGYLRAVGLTDGEMDAIRANLLERVADVTGIEVTPPTKVSYVEGREELDLAGGKLTVSYGDGDSEVIDLTADMVSGFDNTAFGPQTLTVRYNGFTASFDIEIIANLFDVDGDGEVTVADALAALRAAIGLTQPEGPEFRSADVDKDGAITVSDALRILRKAAGLV
ncbi:MAG: tyrosine-protein phosphatase [Clostridia bacterium]|nr:tyrosine-protein phosphatase [Clostridia bacterium]